MASIERARLSDERVIAIVGDRREMVGSLDGLMTRAKAAQRDKALGQVGLHGIGEPMPEWDRVFTPKREQYDKTGALVIHVEAGGVILCGATKGRAGDPTTVTLLIDRWCSRCWNRWSKRGADSVHDASQVAVRRRATAFRRAEPQDTEADEVPYA